MVAPLTVPPPSFEGVRSLRLDAPRVAGTAGTPASDSAGTPASDSGSAGERVARRFFELCEHPRTRRRVLALLQRSADSAVGGRLLVAMLSRRVFVPALRSRRVDHAAARVELVAAQLGGIAVLRYVTCMEPVASMSVEELVALVGPSVQATLSASARP